MRARERKGLRERRVENRRGGRAVDGREGKGRGGKERLYAPPVTNSWLRHCVYIL